MAQSISDVFARANDSEGNTRRQARLVQEPEPETGQENTSQINRAPTDRLRRAAYRPEETRALRRDVVDAFLTAVMRDVRHHPQAPARLHVAAARAAESLGDWDTAAKHLERFEKKGGEVQWADCALRGRVLRAMERDEELLSLLDTMAQLKDAPGWASVYAGLEAATAAWNGGDDAKRVLRGAQKALRASSAPGLDEFASVWAMQLSCDGALEAGDVDAAVEALRQTTQQPELGVATRQVLQARRAVWMHVFGQPAEARRLLEELGQRKALPGDLDDLLVSLCFEDGDVNKAFEVLRSIAGKRCRLRDQAIPLVMLHETGNTQSACGRDVLGEATQQRDDWTLLRLHERLLDVAGCDGSQRAGTELIDVLNRRLEGPMSTDERVNTLTRLGRLYEVEAGLEEAAAEVYREALSYNPRHVPALRALGRLYTRRENWTGLAQLYEREIATVEQGSGSWRRYFQLAEIYEHRLGEYERALENYLVVLEQRPNYLPALKSSARILEKLCRWTQLADLFLRMVESAPSRRQKFYLLDKVAEVAEEKLENYEVAIGAWKEILQLDPQNPRAYTALGRLYARTHRWEDLIELNEAEMELIDDPEEVAAAWLRNAEIAEQQLEDTEAAEGYYRRALDVIPTYLPALEALGRIYLRGGRWVDIVEMTGRELHNVDEPEQATRQLGVLAEILETHLDRREHAITIYEKLWDLRPGDAHVFGALARLYRADGQFERLEKLLNARLQHNPGDEEFSALQGELAILAEWKTNRPQQAYQRYLAALQCEPANHHWLSGVARTWPKADVDAEQVADALEDLMMHVSEEQIRNRYFTVIARLRERAGGSPEASRGYRAHGDAESLENQIVVRLAMACAGERAALSQARQAVPHHQFQPLLTVERNRSDRGIEQMVDELGDALPEPAKEWLGGQLRPQVCNDSLPGSKLSRDLVDVLDGVELYQRDDDSVEQPRRLRLRALQARRMGAHDAYVRWTQRELKQLDAPTTASRRLELARYATRHQLAEEAALYREACAAVFPELNTGDDDVETEQRAQIPEICDELVERLYEALRGTHRWGLLRRCLECQVGRPKQSREERLELFEQLARLLEEQLDDYKGARDALVHCWQLSEQRHFLRRLVTLAEGYGETEDALRFQKKHFEMTSMAGDSTPAQRVQSGVWLAELLIAEDCPEHRESAIEYLEKLSVSYEEVQGLDRARRMLARAHADAGNARRAIELFEQVLHFQIRSEELDDWRRLVDVYRHQLCDLENAYTHQWRIVRAIPGSQRDLDTLVDLAAEAGETQDCIEQLGALASATADENKVSLLARAAEAADEELGHAEEAYRLFERVVELADDDHPRFENYQRRRAVCLARMAGREPRALKAFRTLVDRQPFEPANYRGLEVLFERANALDRLRITRQTLQALGCETESLKQSGKVYPTRALDYAQIERRLIPEPLQDGLFDVLRAARPLVEKVFADDLPQLKALNGRRVRSGDDVEFYDDLEAALIAFGFAKFKLYVGESGPDHPMVFAGSTPVVWINQQLLEQFTDGESRFVAGYCAALVWSQIPTLMNLDGRQVWHLLEGVVYRETGDGFGQRVDVASQQMADEVSSPFDMKKRHNLVRAVEECEQPLDEAHCEAWGRQLELFAARAGLLLSGDVSAAVSSLLKLSGWNMPLHEEATQNRLKNNESVCDLIQLAHSEEYLELRYRTGLAGRPTRLGV